MRILLLTTHMNLGGIGMYVLLLAKGLLKRRHKVFVASSGGNLVGLLESFGAEHLNIKIKTKSVLSPKVFLAYKGLARIIKEKNIELIHAHTRVTQMLAYLVSRKTDIAYVTTCHGFFKPKLFRRILPCWGDRTVAISEAVREHLVNDLRVKKEKIAVVHNGIEINKFSANNFSQEQKEKFKKDYGLKPDAPVIGTIARLSSVKGQRYLILAMKTILESLPDAQLLLVGDGPEKDRLLNQAKELEIERSIFFNSSTFDTSVPLAVMDVFVFPSLMEGLGLAIIEAQAMALPVVASNVGGIYTLIKNGLNGILVHPEDPEALAEATLRILRDKTLSFEMGKRGSLQAREQFSLEQMIEGIEQVYRDTLEGGRS